MTDDQNKNGHPDFEDDVFDETSFDESYYEDDAVYDEADLSDADTDFEDVDFDETDWDDEDEGPVAGKKEKSLYRAEKKSFLSFNTIVIIGAFIVGAGVLVFTVMGQSSKISTNSVPKFISSLNIGDVMDGKIFGIGKDNDAEAIALPQTEAEGEQLAVPENGFLDNPETIELQATGDDVPPQPSPISPAEVAIDHNLTPMPVVSIEDEIAGAGPVPRGPEEAALSNDEPGAETAEAIPAVEGTVQQPSAEDILKRALASRTQKQEEAPVKEEPIVQAKVQEEIPAAPIAPVAAIQEPKKEEKPAAVPVPAPAPTPAPIVEPKQAPVPQVDTASQEAIKSLEGKIDTMLKRMEQIESELNNVRDGRENEYETLEKTVSSLKNDIVALKKAPVATKPAAVAQETQAETKAPVVKKTPAPKKETVAAKTEEKAYSPPKSAVQAAPKATASQGGSWELRAAQPGKAWVSKSGQRDMQGIVVGDTLQGIGKVTSITYQNGRWVVTGTQGQINQ